MKNFFFLLSLSTLLFTKSYCLNITVIESQSYNAGHVMDLNWQTVATGMGNTATIFPQSTLDNTAFFATTDILIVSSGVIILSPLAMTNITAYIQQGGRAYIQGEYDCAAYNTNTLFENMVAQFGGGPFNYMGTVAGTLVPMNVLGALSNTNNSVASLSYYWYGCHGVPGACSIVEPFLEYGGQYFGFVYCAPNTNGGRVIQNTDQDWVLQNTSTQLMENIITNLASNTYNCSTSTSLGVNLGPDISACNGQPVTLDAGAGANYTYLWNTGATTETITITTTGTYFVDVSNGNCSASDTINISLSNPFSINLGNDTLICNGQSVTLDAGNLGLTYLWNTNAVTQTIIASNSGTYWVSVSNGTCSVNDTINITIQSSGSLFIGNDTSICANQFLILNAGNTGSNYLWSDGSVLQTLFVNTAGTYWVEVSNQCGIQSDTVTVTQLQLPIYALGNDTNYCSNFNLLLDAGNNGCSYSWNNFSTNQTLNINTAGTYWVIISNSCGAIDDSIIITQNSSPTVTLGNDTLYCSAFIQILSAVNTGSTYNWSTGSVASSININSGGTYWVNVSNLCGTATDTIVITQNSLPVSTIGVDTLYCDNFSRVLIGGTNASSYLWNDGSTNSSLIVSASGVYNVQLTNICGSVTDSVIILKSVPPTVNLGSDTIYCGSFNQSFDVSCLLCNYLWSDGNQNALENISSPGIITVTVSNGCGIAKDTVTIEQSPTPFLILPKDTFSCNPDGFQISALASPGNIIWNTGDTTLDIVTHKYGTYVATLFSPCGNLTDSVIISECPGEYIIPNAFSPNGDSKNDLLTPIRIGNAKLQLFEVYNRWGQLVYSTNLENDGWDGTFNDLRCSIGVYVYLMRYSVNVTGEIIMKKGNATLLR